MMIEQHYDEEVLIALLDEQAPDDPHLQSCQTCKASLNSIRQVTTALHDETVWDRRELHEEPRPETRSALLSFATSVAREDAAAEPWVKALLAKPASEWRAIVDAHPEWRTAGFVRKLIAAVDAINFTAPTDAVELMKIAVDVAEGLEGASERVARLRARAWREYAYAMNFIGSYQDALSAVDRADEQLSRCSVNEYDRAEVSLIRARVYDALERLEIAAAAVRSAREVFVRFGAKQRVVVADMLEASILMSARRYKDALAVQLQIVGDDAVAPISLACAVHNAAICYREVGQADEAKAFFARAIVEYERLGLASERARARWNFANILVSMTEYTAACAVFEQVRSECRELGMAHVLALVCVDEAQALLLAGEIEKVAPLCQSAIEYFASANLAYTNGAVTALAYVREAAQSRDLTVRDVGQIRAFFEILPKQPELLFARPA